MIIFPVPQLHSDPPHIPNFPFSNYFSFPLLKKKNLQRMEVETNKPKTVSQKEMQKQKDQQ